MGDERRSTGGAGAKDTQPQSTPPQPSGELREEPSVRVLSTRRTGPASRPERDTHSADGAQLTSVALASTNADLPVNANVDEALKAGERVDHFQIMRLLGRGGMGEVYVARDTKLGRKVALKVIHPKYLGSPDAIRSFLEEARTTAKFNHPHIVMIHGVGEHMGRPYVALEYLEGENLRKRMVERKLSLQATMRIAIAVAEALDAAHRDGVLHLDLKPENVMIPEDGRVRVVDFGLARPATMMESGEVRASDDVTGIWGTPAYMAPEQWLRKQPTAATDVWGLGMMLFELCSDWLPYDLEGTKTKLMARVVDPEPVPRIERFAEVPPEVGDLIASCLEKDPRKRPKVTKVAETLRELLFRGARRPADDEGPFRGLLPFTERHAGFFHGRESEVAAFAERIRLQPVLPVVGPSGAGKSSFVQAGLLPRLREEGDWVFLTMRPGSHPFESLAARLLRAHRDVSTPETLPPPPKSSSPSLENLPSGETGSSPTLDAADARLLAEELAEAPGRLALELQRLAHELGVRVLLFVDQVEELFTIFDDASRRHAFMEAICTAADDPDDPVRVVFTVRDDFLGRLAMSETVTRALTQVTLIQRLRHAALAETLVKPLSSVGYRFEDDALVEEMVASVGGAPGALPMLQFAARQLWERRDNVKRVLLRAEYLDMGGVEGALATHADGVLDAMSAAELRAAREILLRLVTDEGTRERLSKSECLAGLRREVEPVLARLTQARLVVTTKKLRDTGAEAMLELAHDSLITSWGTLRRWREESREELVFVHEAGQAAALWDKRGRNPQELWRGQALTAALRMLSRTTTEIPALTAEFLAAANERELGRGRRRRMLFGGALLVSALLTAVFAVVAWVVRERGRDAATQRDIAERQRAATLRESARAAMSQGNVLEARAKLRLALDVEDDPGARALWWQLSENPLVWHKKLGDRAFGVAFTPSGEQVAAGCADGAVYLFDRTTRRMRVLHGNGDQVLGLAASPMGDTLATISTGGPVRIWDIEAASPRPALTGHRQRPTSVRYSRDGKRIATSAQDGTVRVWDVATQKAVHVFELGTEIGAVDFHPGGEIIAAGTENGIVVVQQGTEPVHIDVGHAGLVRALRYDAAGKRIATGGADGRVIVWSADEEKPVVLPGHAGSVWSLAFVGGRLASGGDDGKLRIWNLADRELVREIAAHDKQITGVDLNADGRFAATSSFDGTVRLWDLTAAGSLEGVGEPRSGARGLAFSPDGKLLAHGTYGGEVRMLDVSTAEPRGRLAGHTGRIYEVAFSPDGKLVASTSADWSARIWDVESGRQTRVLTGHAGPVVGVSFSPNGRSVATGSKDATARLWDLSTRGHRVIGEHDFEVGAVAFSPDGKLLGVGARSVVVWNVVEGKRTAELSGHEDAVLGVRFTADGRGIVSGSTDGTVRVWDLKSEKGRVLGRHPQRVYWVDQSQGRVSASSSDGIARIWPAEADAQRGPIELVGHADEVNNAVFSPDGRLVATASDDGTIRVWHADTGRAFWRGPALLEHPLRLLSHRGWKRLGGDAGDDAPVGEESPHRFVAAIEAKAQLATQAGDLLCLLTHDHGLELWNTKSDALLAESDGPFSMVVAHARGCLVRSLRGAEIVSPNMAPTRLPTEGDVSAVGIGREHVAAAVGPQVAIYDADAKPVTAVDVSAGATAVAVLSGAVVVGYRDGHLQIRAIEGAAMDVSFQSVPSSRVVRIVEGPADTVAAGYENGFVGLWSLKDGTLLAQARLHGEVVHLLLSEQHLVAATDLGDHVAWNLGAFYQDYCELVRAVWERVPVVWEGRPVGRNPPAGHACVGAAQ